MNKTDAPRELAIDSDYHNLYNDLKDGKILPELKGYEMAYLFVIALSYGFYFNKFEPIKQGKVKRSISRSFIDREFGWLVKAVAISKSKEGVDLIPDKAEIYRIAENYANGGIKILEKIIKKSKPGEFELFMEKEINKLLKNK